MEELRRIYFRNRQRLVPGSPFQTLRRISGSGVDGCGVGGGVGSGVDNLSDDFSFHCQDLICAVSQRSLATQIRSQQAVMYMLFHSKIMVL